MSNPKITAIAIKSGVELAGLIRECDKEIILGMIKAAEEAQLQEGKARFKIGFTIALDLDADVATYTLGWSTKTTRETSSQIPDPNQLDLPTGGEPDAVSVFIADQLATARREDAAGGGDL